MIVIATTPDGTEILIAAENICTVAHPLDYDSNEAKSVITMTSGQRIALCETIEWWKENLK